MTIEHLKTSDLIPYARNAKKHDASQVAKLAGSIREFGFTNPVLIDKDNGIIAGHGRVLAAQSLALETVPCIRLGHLTDTQRRAYILADNRLAEIGGGWDEEMLKLELADLAALDVDVAEIGFGAEDLADLDMEDEPETSDADAEPQIDKAEELRAKWGVEPGQLWELGAHRILCGDSTIPEHVAKLMGGEKAKLIHADPPYGMGKEKDGVENDNLYRENLDAFQMEWWRVIATRHRPRLRTVPDPHHRIRREPLGTGLPMPPGAHRCDVRPRKNQRSSDPRDRARSTEGIRAEGPTLPKAGTRTRWSCPGARHRPR
jgi:hypothetical protein